MIPDGAYEAMFVIVALLGAAVAAALIFGLPWLWAIIKPYLHAVAA